MVIRSKSMELILDENGDGYFDYRYYCYECKNEIGVDNEWKFCPYCSKKLNQIKHNFIVR